MSKTRTPESFADLINLWPSKPSSSLSNFARDLGIPYVTANLMRQRNNVHPRHWRDLLRAAKRRGIPVTPELLANLAQERALERAS